MSVQNASHAVLEEVATGGVSLWCEECGIKVVAYKGESGRNGFSRGEEHLDNKATKDKEKSIVWAHSVHHHNSSGGNEDRDHNSTPFLLTFWFLPLVCQVRTKRGYHDFFFKF